MPLPVAFVPLNPGAVSTVSVTSLPTEPLAVSPGSVNGPVFGTVIVSGWPETTVAGPNGRPAEPNGATPAALIVAGVAPAASSTKFVTEPFAVAAPSPANEVDHAAGVVRVVDTSVSDTASPGVTEAGPVAVRLTCTVPLTFSTPGASRHGRLNCELNCFVPCAEAEPDPMAATASAATMAVGTSSANGRDRLRLFI